MQRVHHSITLRKRFNWFMLRHLQLTRKKSKSRKSCVVSSPKIILSKTKIEMMVKIWMSYQHRQHYSPWNSTVKIGRVLTISMTTKLILLNWDCKASENQWWSWRRQVLSASQLQRVLRILITNNEVILRQKTTKKKQLRWNRKMNRQKWFRIS